MAAWFSYAADPAVNNYTPINLQLSQRLHNPEDPFLSGLQINIL
jgi:hypothetical protein